MIWPERLGHRWCDRAPANLAKATRSVRDWCLQNLVEWVQKSAGHPVYVRTLAAQSTHLKMRWCNSPLHLVKGGRADTLPWEANTVLDQESIQSASRFSDHSS